MGKTYDKLDDALIEFIKAQKMFFVATAPLSPDGHVIVSPKGYDSFAVIDETTVAWLDLGGSGIETMAHLKENERITIMPNRAVRMAPRPWLTSHGIMARKPNKFRKKTISSGSTSLATWRMIAFIEAKKTQAKISRPAALTGGEGEIVRTRGNRIEAQA